MRLEITAHFHVLLKEILPTHKSRLILAVTHFYPRGASYARVLVVVVCLSVCICLSHAGIVSKR